MIKKEIKTFKDLPKIIFYTTGCIFCVMLFFSYVHLNLVLEQILSLCASFVLIFLAIKNADLLTINENGIAIYRLLRKKQFTSWEEIKEVGVIGTKVFPKTEKSNRGRKYIYFSFNELSDEDRFELALKWPPKIPFTTYTKEKLLSVSLLCSNKPTIINYKNYF